MLFYNLILPLEKINLIKSEEWQLVSPDQSGKWGVGGQGYKKKQKNLIKL